MTDAVWPDGAREAVTSLLKRDQSAIGPNPLTEKVLTALEPFVQQRIEAATRALDDDCRSLRDLQSWVADAVGLAPYMGCYVQDDVLPSVRRVVSERDALRAEVARLREDGERRQAEVLQLRALLAALPISECQASAALQGWWDQMKAVMAGTNPVWLVEPRGCPTPGACSCPGVRLDAARSAPGGEG